MNEKDRAEEEDFERKKKEKKSKWIVLKIESHLQYMSKVKWEIYKENEVSTSEETFERRFACSTINEIKSSFPSIVVSLPDLEVEIPKEMPNDMQ